MNQLAMAKIIVNIHERNSRLLIQAYVNIGEAYIRQNCMESAYDHLTVARIRNEQIDKNSLEYIKDNVRICNLLANCCINSHRKKETVEYLDNAIAMYQEDPNEERLKKDDNFFDILAIKARFALEEKTRVGQSDEEIREAIEEAEETYFELYGLLQDRNIQSDDRLVEAFLGMIKVAERQENYDLANTYLAELISRLLTKEYTNSKYKKTMVIDLQMQRVVLLEMLERGEQVQEQGDPQDFIIECQNKLKHLVRELGDSLDYYHLKLALKGLNKLMLLQSKQKNFEGAMETIVEIEEMYKKSGDSKSKDMAKIQILKSGIYHRHDKIQKARDCMNKAIAIYDSLGLKEKAFKYRESVKEMEEKYMNMI